MNRYNQNLEEGIITDLIRKTIGPKPFAKASEYVSSAANKLSDIAKTVAVDPAEERRKHIDTHVKTGHFAIGEMLRPTAIRHSDEVERSARHASSPETRARAIFTLNSRKAKQEEDLAKQATEAGKKRKSRQPKEPTEREILAEIEQQSGLAEHKAKALQDVIQRGHNLLSLEAQRGSYVADDLGLKGSDHYHTGFSNYYGSGLPENHIYHEYHKAYNNAPEAYKATMAHPDELFGEHTHHVAGEHTGIFSERSVTNPEFRKEILKENKKRERAYQQAVEQAKQHIENVKTGRAKQLLTQAEGTPIKMVEAFQNHHVNLNAGMMYGGFPSKRRK